MIIPNKWHTQGGSIPPPRIPLSPDPLVYLVWWLPSQDSMAFSRCHVYCDCVCKSLIRLKCPLTTTCNRTYIPVNTPYQVKTKDTIRAYAPNQINLTCNSSHSCLRMWQTRRLYISCASPKWVTAWFTMWNYDWSFAYLPLWNETRKRGFHDHVYSRYTNALNLEETSGITPYQWRPGSAPPLWRRYARIEPSLCTAGRLSGYQRCDC